MNVQQRYKWIHAITEIPDPCKILYNNQPLFAPLSKLTRHTGRSNLKNYPVSLHLGRVSFGEISRTRNVTRLTFLCYPYISSGSQVAFFPSTRPHCSLFTIPFSLSLSFSLWWVTDLLAWYISVIPRAALLKICIPFMVCVTVVVRVTQVWCSLVFYRFTIVSFRYR